ncbi:MAG: fused MFS/spermidine synthase, partial [Candidatus Marinimicrobia bacterium]|nr:fused MFS/spermidine synthase [Candidatus Neomarinimicrobiota bacterium]
MKTFQYPDRIKVVLLLVFFGSGSAALIYQLVWVRLLGEIFGRTTYAISTVLACFMGGLAFGSWLIGKLKSWQKNPVTWYIGIEIGIGVTALVVNLLINHLDILYRPFYSTLHSNQMLLSLIRLVISVPLLLIPTSLMGATFPVLSTIYFQRNDHIGKDFSLLYAINTLGAGVGALLTGFFLIEYFGVFYTGLFAVVLNLGVAGTVFLVRTQITLVENAALSDRSSALPEKADINTIDHAGIYKTVLFINGFIALGLEVFWVRMFAYFVGNSTYAFTLILVMHLAGIAIGSWLISHFADKSKQPGRLLVWLQIASAISLMIALFSFSGVFRTFFTAPAHSWGGYLLSTLMKTAIILLPPTILMGSIFPLLNRVLLKAIHNIGPRLGRLYALNTLGAITGSLLAGFIFIRVIGVSTSIAISAVLYSLSALFIAFTIKKQPSRNQTMVSALVVFILMGVIGFKVQGYQLATWEELKADKVLFYKEGVSATAKVYHTNEDNKGLVLTANGSMIGADNRSIMRKQAMLAHLPMLVLPQAKKAFVVGLGTGVTLGEMLKYPLNRVVCAEISEAVIDASRQFSHVNHLDYNDPRIQWIKDDGKIWLANTSEKFDLISSDTMLRRGSSGNGRMYTRDYYQL